MRAKLHKERTPAATPHPYPTSHHTTPHHTKPPLFPTIPSFYTHQERKALQKREKKQQKKKSSPTGKGATDLV